MSDQSQRAIEILKDHKLFDLEWVKGGAIVQYRREDSSTYAMQIVFLNNFNTVVITGDAYSAIYQWGGNEKKLSFFNGMDMYYFMSKCEAWSTKTAKSYIETDDVLRMVIDGFIQYGCLPEIDDKTDLKRYFNYFLNAADIDEDDFISFDELRQKCSEDNMQQIHFWLMQNDSINDYFDGYLHEYLTDVSKPIITQYIHHQAVCKVAGELQLLDTAKEFSKTLENNKPETAQN